MNDSIADETALAEAYNRGLALEKQGDIAGAVTAFREALALDADDPGGVAVRLAALGVGPSPDVAPPAYVEMLFDQHAGAFEDILVDQLDYHVPRLIRQKLDQLGLVPFSRMLDLGCGTGLGAEALGDAAGEIIGIDISEAMIDVAENKDAYDGLYIGEVVGFLEDNDEDPFDFIMAADVLPYLGAVGPLFAGVADALLPRGVFAFSTELLTGTADEAGKGYAVGVNRRFLHAERYLRAELDRAGFAVLGIDEINVRNEDDAPSPGHLVVVRKQ